MDGLSIVAIGLPLAASLAAFITLAVVLWGAQDRRLAISLGGFAAFIGLWNMLVGLQAIGGATDAIPGFLNFLRYPFILLPAVGLDTIARWSGLQSRTLRSVTLIGYCFASGFVALHACDLLFDGWIRYGWGAVGRPKPMYAYFVIYAAGWLIAMAGTAVRSLWLPLNPVARLRMKYLAIAGVVGVPLGLTNFLAGYGVGVPPLGGLASILVLGVLGYGALRHRMLDIDVVLLKSAASIFAIAVLATPMTVAVVLVETSANGHANSGVTLAIGLAILVSIAAYSRARDAITLAIERSLFPSRHAARQAIEALSRNVVEPAHAESLGRDIASTLGPSLNVAGAALYVHEDHSYRREGLWGESGGPGVVSDIPSTGWEHCIAVGSATPLGFIALGPKLSGASIDDLDMTLLKVLASQVAVALKNIEYVRQVEAQKDAIEQQKAVVEQQKAVVERQKAEIEELQKKLLAENTVLRAEVRSVSGFEGIVGASPALQSALRVVDRAAASEMSILITGETGTGKELVARAIHERSRRAGGPLITVNCPAIPQELAEAELFGYERGAFTGADEARPGRFEMAHGGTIFLDEVADLPYRVQTKLLRVLQEREVQRLGSARLRRVDVRIVAATNRDLQSAMARGAFREDLYHRLAAVQTELPPLRHRIEDIEMLATHVLDRATRTHQKSITAFSRAAMRALRSYNWPGNIRELQNIVERAVLLCDGDAIAPAHLGDLGQQSPARSNLSISMRQEKGRRVEEALAESGGSQAEAARRLGMSPSNLTRLMKSLGIKSSRPLQ